MTAPETLHLLATAPADLALLGLAQSQTLPDTIVTVQAGTYGFQRVVQTLQSIASVVIALVLIAISVSLIPAAWNTRKFYKQVNDLIKRFKNDVDPLLRHANDVAENVNYISTAMRADVEQLQRTIAATQLRLTQAAAATEQRVGEFNALLHVVQEEAESLFISTASTVRGVQVGADTFRRFQTGEAELDPAYGDEELEELFYEDDPYDGDEDPDDDGRPQIRVERRDRRPDGRDA